MSLGSYYNEFDPKAAAWLRELIKRGLIPDGEVDERSITEVRAADVAGFIQCHFFAGIAGWPYALRLAGWPDDRPVWTGSCPCQPFSAAGKGLGEKDERHLWPEFKRIIKECRPSIAFGEQVASKAGRAWLSGVRAEMEALGYDFGAADLCAAGIGAPHIRQRLFWGGRRADSECWTAERYGFEMAGTQEKMQGEARQQRIRSDTGNGIDAGGVGNAESNDERRDAMSGKDGQGLSPGRSGGDLCGVGESNGNGSQSRSETAAPAGYGNPSISTGCWHDAVCHRCSDGKARRIPLEPAFFPLADGLPARVVRLRGYGNAIVPELAKEFIEAFIDCLEIT